MGVDSPATPSLRLRGSRRAAGESDVAADQQQRQHKDNANEPHSHRRLEDANVDYWRKRAGWADDDESMKSYNQGVYNTYYLGDDAVGTGSSGSTASGGAHTGNRALDHLGWILGLASTVIFLVLLVKCCSSAPSTSSRKRTSSVKSRDSSRSIRDKHRERRSRSRSRAAGGRSRSKSRTRSKSRRKEKDGEYRLMDDEEVDNKSRRSTRSTNSKKSSRSRSRSKARSRSRSKPRSKSRSSRKSRGGGQGGSGGGSEEDKADKKKESSKEQKMLV